MNALIAGFGNIFLKDDGYGSAVARALAAETLPPQVKVVDFGIRGVHAAYDLLEDYDLVIFADAASRGAAPGTLYVIEPQTGGETLPDAHAMELETVLALYERLAQQMPPAKRPRILIIGCEPADVGEGIGLSEAVSDAVGRTLPVIRELLANHGIGEYSYET